MSALQWALLIFAVIAMIAVYLYSRRDRRAMDNWESDDSGEPLLPPRDQQLDIFAGGQFDEFGVGKPRRIEPSIDDMDREAPPARGPQANRAPDRDSDTTPLRAEPRLKTGRATRAPSISAPTSESSMSDAPMAPPAKPRVEEKIVALLIAERDGGKIPGPRLHAALQAQALEFGDRQIYHRLHEDTPVFSVASLVKPGYLDPAQASEFETPGLTVFMVLPGPQLPATAIRDMLATAGRLAEALNSQVYDAKRKPLTPNAIRDLQQDVESWARRNKIS